jgi:hypothetical protein
MNRRDGCGRGLSATSTATTATPRYRRQADPVAAIVTRIEDAWPRRFERVDRQAGPYWPSWRCCFSWTAAEASRRAG